MSLEIGSTVYNRRATPVVITGETRASWIIGDEYPWNQVKIKKAAMRKGNSGEDYPQYFVQEQDATDCAYATDNYDEISKAVGNCRDGALLRIIADLIGYKTA